MNNFGQLLLAVSIPTLVALIGVVLNQIGYYHLSNRVDRLTERFEDRVTTLLTTIHDVHVRVVKLEDNSKG